MGKLVKRVLAIWVVIALVALAAGACMSGCKKGSAGPGADGEPVMKGGNAPNPKAHMSPDQAKKGGGGPAKMGKKASKDMFDSVGKEKGGD